MQGLCIKRNEPSDDEQEKKGQDKRRERLKRRGSQSTTDATHSQGESNDSKNVGKTSHEK